MCRVVAVPNPSAAVTITLVSNLKPGALKRPPENDPPVPGRAGSLSAHKLVRQKAEGQ